jgi:hypothetical protein
MVGSGHVDKGAIYSIAGDSKWAGSTGFEVRLTTTCCLNLETWSYARGSLEIGHGKEVIDKEDELTMG